MLLGTGLVKKSSPTKVGPRTAGRSTVGAGLVENPLFCLGSPPVVGAGMVKKPSPTNYRFFDKYKNNTCSDWLVPS